MDLTKLVKWVKPQGIELTFIKARGREWSGSGYADECRLKWVHLFPVHREHWLRDTAVGADPGCTEFSSPILRSWAAAEEFYEYATAVAESAGLVAWRDGYPGGGGHIHTGSLSLQAIKNCFADMQARPYLSWACISPYDDCNAAPLLGTSSRRVAAVLELHNIRSTPGGRLGFCSLGYRTSMLRFSYSYQTVEWRAWDSAADWSIQVCHLALVQRYMQVMEAKGRKVLPVQLAEDGRRLLDSYAKNLDRCIREFREFITHTMELPWSEYEWLVERNLVPRFKRGPTYMGLDEWKR